MTIGDGLFCLGLSYLLVNMLYYVYTYFTVKFPNKQIKRLDKIEAILREDGVDIE